MEGKAVEQAPLTDPAQESIIHLLQSESFFPRLAQLILGITSETKSLPPLNEVLPPPKNSTVSAGPPSLTEVDLCWGTSGDVSGNTSLTNLSFTEHNPKTKHQIHEVNEKIVTETITPTTLITTKHHTNKPVKKYTPCIVEAYPKMIMDTSDLSIFVGGLPLSVHNIELAKMFEQFGPIEAARVSRWTSTGISRGFGFIKFRDNRSRFEKSCSNI